MASMTSIGAAGGLSDQEISDQEFNNVMDYPESVDFYSLLGLSREPPPTEAEIRSAFRILTLSFHPDKQPPHLRDAATKQYRRIQTAYETLMDPRKRVVYDMLGEEGVQAEWATGGAMGAGGEAEKQVGVKTMDADQFRKWFLATMKQRERKALERMVRAKGLVQLRVDARPLFRPNANKQSLKPTSIALGFNFTTPFSLLRWLKEYNEPDNVDEGEEEEENAAVKGLYDEEPELEVHATIGGGFKRVFQRVALVNEDTGEEEEHQVELPPMVMSSDISLGATLSHSVNNDTGNGAILNQLLFPFLGDSVVQFSTFALPQPSIQTTVRKTITLVPNTFPVNLAVQSMFSKNPLRWPPIMTVTASRQLGPRTIAYGTWSSGVVAWPGFIQTILSSVVDYSSPENIISVASAAQTSQFVLGMYILPTKSPRERARADADEDDIVDMEDEEGEMAGVVRTGESKETWNVGVQSSPFDVAVVVNYSRNIFTGRVEQPKLSEWNLEGYYPNKETRGDRSVRLQIETTVHLDLSLSWTVTGTRKVGDFTHVGVGIGIEGRSGLVVSLTWRRLGQTIKLPVVLFPVEFVKGVGPLAAIVPWLAYSALEFGYLRPRERRKQRRMLAKQRKRIMKLVAKRKKESLEAIDLMRDQVQRRQAKEAAKDGLVILHAEYGFVPSKPSEKAQDQASEQSSQLIDVTIPVAALVDQSQLSIPSNVNKSHIVGFYDPAPLLPKILRVRYRFAGREHAVEIDDSEELVCPMRSHAV
ncbi:hypothetical protein VTO42DRAFT_2237 [Malbranchea cinnamomea]